MGLTDNEADCSIRISIPDDMTIDDVDKVVDIIKTNIDNVSSLQDDENN